MNGPWHYQEAERLMLGAGDSDDSPPSARLAAAQTHATLALAAATALASPQPYERVDGNLVASGWDSSVVWDAWAEVAR
jgi:hypothetical protein